MKSAPTMKPCQKPPVEHSLDLQIRAQAKRGLGVVCAGTK